jgi:hypothetical protein
MPWTISTRRSKPRPMSNAPRRPNPQAGRVFARRRKPNFQASRPDSGLGNNQRGRGRVARRKVTSSQRHRRG